MIENRCGSIYKEEAFTMSTAMQVSTLANQIADEGLSLRITLDIPQLYTAHGVTQKHHSRGLGALASLAEVREFIAGVHLWGKGQNKKGRR